MTKRIAHIVIALLAIIAMAGCQRRPLEEMSERISVRVKVNISAVANVTTNVYNDRIPAPDITTDMMRVMVYDPYNHDLLTQSFIYNKTIDESGNQVLSGDLNISYGTYDILVYNFDVASTQIAAENNEESIIAYTDEISSSMKSSLFGYNASKADIDEFEHIQYEPDHLVVARENDLRVSPHDTIVVINTTASTIIDTYYLQIRVKGMKFASTANAIISGLSPSNHFGTNTRTTDPSTAVAFELHKSTDPNIADENQDVLCATFNTFGKIPEASSNLYVTFNVIDAAGNLQKYSTSLDTIFQTEDAIERHWLLIDETFEIKDPGISTGGNGGFQPVVDDWEEEEGSVTL